MNLKISTSMSAQPIILLQVKFPFLSNLRGIFISYLRNGRFVPYYLSKGKNGNAKHHKMSVLSLFSRLENN